MKNGDGGEVMHVVLTDDGKAHPVTRFEDGITAASMAPDGTLYLVSRKGAPNGRVLRLASGHYALSEAKEIVAAGEQSIQPARAPWSPPKAVSMSITWSADPRKCMSSTAKDIPRANCPCPRSRRRRR